MALPVVQHEAACIAGSKGLMSVPMHPEFSTLAKALSWVVMTGLCGWVGGIAQSKAATPPAADARQRTFADLIECVRVGACGVPRTEDKQKKTEADRLYLQGGYFRDVEAVALGHPGSMRRLGLLLWEGCEYEEKNPAKAVVLLRRAARLGDAEAQLWLWYQIGNGAVAPEEPAEDRKWIRKFAEQTKPAIKLPLATGLLTGDAGLPKDPEAAVQLFHAAVRARNGEKGSEIARRFLGGIEGFPKDVSLAIEFYQEAGAFGDVNALKTLGEMYATGQNVRKDPVEAWLLFNTAKVLNDRQAAEALRKLEATMSSAERAQVQQRIRAKSKEQLQLAEDGCRTLQELESMGFFEAEIGDNRNRTRLSVLEASYMQIMGDDPTKPLVVTRELGQNYVMAREVWKAIAQTNRAFAEAWALVDANGGLEGSGDIRLRCRGELPFWMSTTVGGSGAEAPVLYRMRTLKQQLDRGGPGACLSPGDELDLRDLKKQAETHLAEYRGLAKAYTTIVAGLEAAGARGRRVDMFKMVDEMIAEAGRQGGTNSQAGSGTAGPRAETEPASQRVNQITPERATQGATDDDDPPEDLVLRALETGAKDKAECERLLQKAALKNYPPALFNLYVGYSFGYFKTGIVTDGDPAKAAHFRRLWLEADGSSAALQAIGEGYLAGRLMIQREPLVALLQKEEVDLDRIVNMSAGMAYGAEQNERCVLAAKYDSSTLTMQGAARTETLIVCNYRVIFQGRRWVPPATEVPGNLQELSYPQDVGTACQYFAKAAWTAVKRLKGASRNPARDVPVLERSLDVMGRALIEKKWRPSADSKLPALAKEAVELTAQVREFKVPSTFTRGLSVLQKTSSDQEYLESIGIK